MAKKRKRGSRRPHHGHFGTVLKVLSSVVALGAMAVAAVVFFRVEYVEVTGNDRYTPEEIVNASGIEIDDNLFLLDKPTIERNVLGEMAYVESVNVERQLPSTVVVGVKEITTTVMLAQTDATWRISLGGKLVERIDNAMPEMPYVAGLELLSPSVGTLMTLGEDEQDIALRDSLLTLLGALESLEMLDQLEYIDMSDETVLVIEYGGRFTVKFLYEDDYVYKLQSLQVVVDQLETNEVGIIDLTMDGKAHFIPST